MVPIFFEISKDVPTKFPDDERFKLYKVYAKNKATSYLDVIMSLFTVQTTLHDPMTPGGDRVKAGNRTSAGGMVTSAAGKKAVGAKLDNLIADLASDGATNQKTKTPKSNSKKGEKEKDVNKELQKDIRAFLASTIFNIDVGTLQPIIHEAT